MSNNPIQWVPGNALVSQATQTFNLNDYLLAQRGYLLPGHLQRRVLWNLPIGQLLDSAGRMPTIGSKTPGDATYTVYDETLRVRSGAGLRFVPGRFGMVSAVKLEGEPHLSEQPLWFGYDQAGIDPNWDVLEPAVIDGEVINGRQRLTISNPTGLAGIRRTLVATPNQAGTYTSVQCALKTYKGTFDALEVVVRGYDATATPIYEQSYPLAKIGNRYQASFRTPSLTDFGNLPGQTTQIVHTVGLTLQVASTVSAEGLIYGFQIETGFPTSVNLGDLPRGMDKLKFELPAETPETVTLALWFKGPRQGADRDLRLLGEPGGSLSLERLAVAGEADNVLLLGLKTDGGPQSFLLTPAESVLDEQPHLFVLAFGYEGQDPVAYVSFDGQDLGTDTDAEGRACLKAPTGERWDLTGLLTFSMGESFIELENPVLFAGILSDLETALFYQTAVPVQSMTAPQALAGGGLTDWQVVAVTPGMTQIDVGVTGLKLVDLLVDDVPQYEGANYQYDPVTGIIDFAHPSLQAPGPIDGQVARFRFAAQSFLGGDAETLNGRQGISADDPAINTPAAANRYIALNQYGQLPAIIGLPASHFVAQSEKGATVATLATDPLSGQKWLTQDQRPIASADGLGMVKIGQYLTMTPNQQLTLQKAPLWAEQLGALGGAAKLDAQGFLDATHRPRASATQFGMVKVSEDPNTPYGIYLTPDGFLDLAVDSAIDRNEKGPLGSPATGNSPFADRRVATLKQYTNRFFLSPEERPIAQPVTAGTLDELGMVKVGQSLSIDSGTGVLSIARLGQPATQPSPGQPTSLPGVATLNQDGRLTEAQRPLMSPTNVGMAQHGPGMLIDGTTLKYNLGSGLQVASDKLTVKLGPGLVIDANGRIDVPGGGYVPASVVPGFTVGTDSWTNVKLARLVEINGKLVLEPAQRPIAKIGTTPVDLGMVSLAPADVGHLVIDANGTVRVREATEPGNGELTGQAGVVRLGPVEQTGLYIDEGVLKVRPPVPDFTDFNQRQERNLAAGLIGKWVTYSLDPNDASADSGDYVDAIRREVDPVTQVIQWKMELYGGESITYKDLTSVPTDLGRGYVAGTSSLTQSGGITSLDRITALETATLVKSTVSLTTGFLSKSAAAGIDDNGYFFGGQVPGSSPTAVKTIARIDRSETVGILTGQEMATPRISAAAAATGHKAFVCGGYNSPSTSTPLDTFDQLAYSENLAEVVTPLSKKLASHGPAEDGNQGARAGHIGLGFPLGAFFLTGTASTGVNLVAASKATKVLPNGSDVLVVSLILDAHSQPYQPRKLAAGACLDRYGYVAGGHNTAGGFQKIERFDPTYYQNQVTSIRLAGAAQGIGVNERYTATAAVATREKLFFVYEMDGGSLPANVIDRMDKRETLTTLAATLTQRRQFATGVSVLG